MKNGFAAYEGINKLAKALFAGKRVEVQALIFGDSYNIFVDGEEVIKGSSNDVRERLVQLIQGKSKEVTQ